MELIKVEHLMAAEHIVVKNVGIFGQKECKIGKSNIVLRDQGINLKIQIQKINMLERNKNA